MKRTHVFGFILAALATVALGATTYTRLAGYSRQGPTQFIALPDANHAALAGIHVGDGTADFATTPDDAYVEGALEVDGAFTSMVKQVVYNTTTTARTVLASESGTTFVVTDSSDDPVTFNLPAATAGLRYVFIDNDVTAAADLTIDSATGDKINNGTAAANISCRTDAAAAIIIECVDGTNWITYGANGTWTAEGS